MKTKIFATLCLLFIGLALHAQVGEQRYNFAIGVNGGINMNKVSFMPTVNQKNLMGINAGLTARYISEKYFNMICGAQIEVNFSQRGWDEFYEYTPDVHYTRTMNYVEIPFLAHLAFGKDKGLQFFLNIGPQVAFLISDSEKQTGDMNEVIANNTANPSTTSSTTASPAASGRSCAPSSATSWWKAAITSALPISTTARRKTTSPARPTEALW